MKINIQMIICTLLDIHLKNPLCKLRKQRFLQPLQRIPAACLLSQICPLIKTTSADRIRRILLRIQPFLLRLITKQIHPKRPVLQLLPDRNNKRILNLWFIFNTHLFFLLHSNSSSKDFNNHTQHQINNRNICLQFFCLLSQIHFPILTIPSLIPPAPGALAPTNSPSTSPPSSHQRQGPSPRTRVPQTTVRRVLGKYQPAQMFGRDYGG